MRWPWVTNRRLLDELQAVKQLLQFVNNNQNTTHGLQWEFGVALEDMMAKAADAKKAIAAEFDAVRNDLAGIASGVKSQTDAIAALRNQINNGGQVDDKDWDTIIAQGAAVQKAADDMVAAFPVEPPVEVSPADGTGGDGSTTGGM